MKKLNYIPLVLLAFLLIQSCSSENSPLAAPEPEMDDPGSSHMVIIEDPNKGSGGEENTNIVLVGSDGEELDTGIEDIELSDGTMLSAGLQAILERALEFADGRGRFPERLARIRFLVRARIYLWRLYKSGEITRQQMKDILRALRKADLF